MKKVLVVFMLMSLIVSCSDTFVETSASVQGIVYDSVTGAPIVEAWFIMNDTLNTDDFQYTDSMGNYHWITFGVLEGILYVGKGGYQTRYKDLGRLTKDTPEIDFELPPVR